MSGYCMHSLTYLCPLHSSNYYFPVSRLCLHYSHRKCCFIVGDGKCVICDSYVRPCTLVRICDECNYGSYQGRCVICGGPGVSDAYYCKECTIMEKDVRLTSAILWMNLCLKVCSQTDCLVLLSYLLDPLFFRWLFKQWRSCSLASIC